MRQRPIFLVSSGRCGSTFLSDSINLHPRLLSVSELIEPVMEVPFLDDRTVVSGAAFFDRLAARTMEERVRIWQAQKTRECLFLPERDEAISLLLCYALPALSDQPLRLFEAVRAELSRYAPATPAQHFVRFCDFLRQRFGKALWIERSGGSLPHTRRILQCWPEARIVHFYRDGRQTACSMQAHPIFRAFAMRRLGMPWDQEFVPPLEAFGAMWQEWVLDALAALEESAATRLDIAFEDLVTDPAAVLRRFLAFVKDDDAVTAEDRAWMRLVESRIRPPRDHWRTLPAEEQDRLQRSCERGLSALGYGEFCGRRRG